MMSHTAWNRLYHAVEGYVQPIGDFGMYSLAHRTMKEAVVARYFSDDPDGPTRTYNRLTSFLRKQIDPERDGVWTASGHSAYDDLVYYLVSVLDLPGLHDTLLDVRFVWSRALEGHASLESLLLDYQHARHRLASAKYSEVKAYLQHEGTTREDELLALGEFREFVAANSSEMAQAPYLSFQTALNQPDGSAPFVSAMKWLEEHEGAHAQRRSNKVSSERLLQEPVIPDNWIQWVNKPARRRLLSRFEHKTVVMCVASQPNVEGRLALGFGDSSIEIVDGPTHKVEHNYGTGPHSDGITAIAFSVDGQRLASGCESGTVMVWNTSVGTAIASASGHTERIAGMAWLEKMPQRTLVSIGNDSAVKIWFEKKNDTGASIECVWKDDWLKSMPLAVATNPATHQVVIAHTQGRVSVWDASAPQLEVIHQGAVLAHTGKCTAVHVSHGGQFMVTGGVTGDVKVWGPDEEATGGWKDLCLELTRSHTAAITCACFASSSFDFVTASRDGSTIVWNAASLAPKLCLRQDDVVVFGDLNYRLDGLPDEAVAELLAANELETLKLHDQLHRHRRAGSVCWGLSEAPLTFGPTYKFAPESCEYSGGGKGRVPAWTDRILFRGDVSCKAYIAGMDVCGSDHKPVLALLLVHVFQQPSSKMPNTYANYQTCKPPTVRKSLSDEDAYERKT